MISLASLSGSLAVAFGDVVQEEILNRTEPDQVRRELDMAIMRGTIEAGAVAAMMFYGKDDKNAVGRVAEGAYYTNNALLLKSLKFWIWDVAITKQVSIASLTNRLSAKEKEVFERLKQIDQSAD